MSGRKPGEGDVGMLDRGGGREHGAIRSASGWPGSRFQSGSGHPERREAVSERMGALRHQGQIR